jgi:succinate dehydrogenase / fumarate reductase flavoprotein subunit
VSCIFSGDVAGPAASQWAKGLAKGADSVDKAVFDREVARMKAEVDAVAARTGGENPFKIVDELGYLMLSECTIVRHNDGLKKARAKLDDLQARADKATVPDSAKTANQSLRFAHQLPYLVQLAKVMVDGALALERKPRRARQTRIRKARRRELDEDDHGELRREVECARVVSSDAPVDARFIKPRPRTYGAGGS